MVLRESTIAIEEVKVRIGGQAVANRWYLRVARKYPQAIIMTLNHHSAPLGVVGRIVIDARSADGKIRTNDQASHGAKNFRRSADTPTIIEPTMTRFIPIMCTAYAVLATGLVPGVGVVRPF